MAISLFSRMKFLEETVEWFGRVALLALSWNRRPDQWFLNKKNNVYKKTLKKEGKG